MHAPRTAPRVRVRASDTLRHPFPSPPPAPPSRMGVKFFEFYVCPGIRWAHEASLLILPAFHPFLRAIGRYHCQNGNGPIKIPNRCYGRSFVVSLRWEGGRGVVGTGKRQRRWQTVFIPLRSIARSTINSCSHEHCVDVRREWLR